MLWLKADAISGLNDGDLVSSWLDQSGNAFNFSASGSARPTYKTNIQNGNPVVRFNGTSTYMSTSNVQTGSAVN